MLIQELALAHLLSAWVWYGMVLSYHALELLVVVGHVDCGVSGCLVRTTATPVPGEEAGCYGCAGAGKLDTNC